MTQTIFSILGHEDFWEKFSERFPLFEGAWYEVYIDFMEDAFNPLCSEEENLQAAYSYINTHRNDY